MTIKVPKEKYKENPRGEGTGLIYLEETEERPHSLDRP